MRPSHPWETKMCCTTYIFVCLGCKRAVCFHCSWGISVQYFLGKWDSDNGARGKGEQTRDKEKKVTAPKSLQSYLFPLFVVQPLAQEEPGPGLQLSDGIAVQTPLKILE